MSWTRFFRRRQWDRERALELQAYLDEETADNIARGLDPIEARRAAYRRLGNPTRIREEIYTMNTIGFVESAWGDLRFGLRLLRRNPTFALVAVLTLALGTGANAAIFQIVDALRLRTLPVADPHELVEVRIDSRGQGRTGTFRSRRPMLTNPLWERIRDRQQVFESVLAWSPQMFDLAGGGTQRPAQGLWVSGSFFNTLGVQPALGRLIAPADDVRGCGTPGVVLSEAFWRREYGGDPRALERTILLDGLRFDIIGITPASFFGVEVGRSFDVALPLCSEPLFRGEDSGLDRPDFWFLAVMGRLPSGRTVEDVAGHLRAIGPAMFEETVPTAYVAADAKAYREFGFEVTPAARGVSTLRSTYARPLDVLLGVTVLVLLITCANLANLMLARASAREREIGVRLAIGASRGRLVRQMLAESLLLAVLGAVAGLLLARWFSGFLVAFLSAEGRPAFLDLKFDWRIVAFAAATASMACLLFGLAPALRATSAVRPVSVLNTRGAGERAERFALRRALVVVQVALSLVLVVGALLFGRSLRNLATLDPGFREEGLLVVEVDFRRAQLAPANRRAVYDTVIERLQHVPGVDGAVETAVAPLSGSGWNNRIVIDGEVKSEIVNFNAVGPGFFRTTRTRLVAGREFTPHDRPGAPPVAVVNELFARTFFPGSDPIGRTFHVQDPPGGTPLPRPQIVGVVGDTKYTGLREELTPIAYVPALQESELGDSLQLLVRTATGPGAVTGPIADVVRQVHPAIALQFRPMDRMVRDSLLSERLMATLSGFFGGLAVLIATIGVYGMMSYMVTRRRAEMGIRMALGADRGTVMRLVLGDAVRLLALGVLAGTILAALAGRAAVALLYGLEPWDPVTLALAAMTLGGVATLASSVPAYRVSRTDPTVALRED